MIFRQKSLPKIFRRSNTNHKDLVAQSFLYLLNTIRLELFVEGHCESQLEKLLSLLSD